MLKYLKSDFGIVVSLFILYLFNDDQEWAKYAIGIALLFPVFYSLDNICN
jgi:hypothetical protein